jgi:hypothetical protein
LKVASAKRRPELEGKHGWERSRGGGLVVLVGGQACHRECREGGLGGAVEERFVFAGLAEGFDAPQDRDQKSAESACIGLWVDVAVALRPVYGGDEQLLVAVIGLEGPSSDCQVLAGQFGGLLSQQAAADGRS